MTYGVVSDILSQSGFNWDSGRKMITVDDNNVWNEYAKTHNDASKYRFKTIANWDDLVDLCAKDRATEYGAENAEDASETMSIEGDNTSLSGTGGSFQDDSLKRKAISSTSTVPSQQKKVKVEETIAMAVSEMASSIKEMVSSMVSTTSKKANVTVDEVYEEMMTIPDLEEDLRWRAIEVFANNATKFQILKKIPLEKKSEFVLKSMPRDI